MWFNVDSKQWILEYKIMFTFEEIRLTDILESILSTPASLHHQSLSLISGFSVASKDVTKQSISKWHYD